VPDHESTGNLKIEFTRNEKKFPINRYVKQIPVKKSTGYYLEMTNEEAGRLLVDGEVAWPDNAPRPLGEGTTESHAFKDYRIDRKAFSTPLGNMTINEASWDVTAQYQRINAQKAMTRRTKVATTALTTSGNYDSSHVSTVAAICGSGETWASSTGTTLNIKKCIDYAMSKIEQDTLSSVSLEDMLLVLNPDLAAKMSITGELREYLKGSPDAKSVLSGSYSGASKRGLPEMLYDVRVVIENTAQTTSRRGATVAKSYLMGNAVAALIARPGGLESPEGPQFSTISMFVHDQMDMLSEKYEDVLNQRTITSIVDGIDVKMTAPVTGFLFTSCQ
jgi:hypothetical protein